MILHDADAAFLAAGLLCRRVGSPAPETVRRALEAALELASNGELVLPLGFLADLDLLFRDGSAAHFRTDPCPLLSSALVRRYEDDVLAKLAMSPSFDRVAAALSRFRGRDSARGLAFLAANLLSQCDAEGADVRAGTVRSLLEMNCDELIRAGLESQRDRRVSEWLAHFYERLCDSFRECGDIPAADAIFELERGTAVATFSQRLALRHLLHAATAFEAELAERPHRDSAVRDVATPHAAEDEYPVGGFASISTRGSLESLLHSQLAFMEADDRPDLFDIKFVRDELLYYSRDENQIRRPRTHIVFAFHPDLVEARIKDAGLPWQRLITACGLIVALIRRLTEWHASESLHFDLVFLSDRTRTTRQHPLAQEHELLALVLQDVAARGAATFRVMSNEELDSHCRHLTRTARTLRVDLSTTDLTGAASTVPRSWLSLRNATLQVRTDTVDRDGTFPDAAESCEDLWSGWRNAARSLGCELQ